MEFKTESNTKNGMDYSTIVLIENQTSGCAIEKNRKSLKLN